MVEILQIDFYNLIHTWRANMLKLATTIFLFLLMQFAYAESDVEALLQDGTAEVPDYMISFIDAEPGQTVHKEWNVEHKYFENVLGWNFNDYCDAFRKHNPQFAHLFNDVSGETNPGFKKLPAGERWNMPVPFSATSLQQLDLQQNEDFTAEVVGDSIIIAKMPKGIAQTRLIDRAFEIDSKAFLSRVDYVLEQNNTGFSVTKIENVELATNEGLGAAVEKVDAQITSNEQEILPPSRMTADILTEHFKGTMFEYLIQPGVLVAGAALLFFGFLIGRLSKTPKEDKTREAMLEHELKKSREELESLQEVLEFTKEELDLERLHHTFDSKKSKEESKVDVAFLKQSLDDAEAQFESQLLEISKLEEESFELEQKFANLQSTVITLMNVAERQRKNTIPLRLPPEIFRTDFDEQVIDLQVSEWEGEPGKSDASVYVQDTEEMLRIPYDEEKKEFNIDPFINLIRSNSIPTKKMRKHYGRIGVVSSLQPKQHSGAFTKG